MVSLLFVFLSGTQLASMSLHAVKLREKARLGFSSLPGASFLSVLCGLMAFTRDKGMG